MVKTLTPAEQWEILRREAEPDNHPIGHDPETCGLCKQQQCMMVAAQELVSYHDAGWDCDDPTVAWARRWSELWHATKFFKLAQEEIAAGRNWRAAFAARGWEP